MRIAFGILLIAHGLVHSGLSFAPDPADPDASPLAFFTSLKRSWLLSRLEVRPSLAKWTGISLVVITSIGFLLAGIGVLSSGALSGIWQPLALASALASLLLLVLFWHPWLPIGVLVNAAVLASVLGRLFA